MIHRARRPVAPQARTSCATEDPAGVEWGCAVFTTGAGGNDLVMRKHAPPEGLASAGPPRPDSRWASVGSARKIRRSASLFIELMRIDMRTKTAAFQMTAALELAIETTRRIEETPFSQPARVATIWACGSMPLRRDLLPQVHRRRIDVGVRWDASAGPPPPD
jgi:hypothetical protein